MLKKHNIQSWLEDNPDWNASQDMPQTLYISLGAVSVPDLQAASAATNSTSPDGRVAWHRIWGATLVTASDGTKQVKLSILLQDFNEILHKTYSKSDQAQMYAKSLANFLEE
eukprot:2254821-Ditylum_brightwellii.AAC.1